MSERDGQVNKSEVLPLTDMFTEKQMAAGKAYFERTVDSWRDTGSLPEVLARSIRWKVAYVDSLAAELRALRAENERLKDESSLWADMNAAIAAEYDRSEILRAALVEILSEDYHLAVTIAAEALTAAGSPLRAFLAAAGEEETT